MEYASYIPFWDKLTADQRNQIAQVIEFRTVKKGTHIHDSSADCLGLVMVKSGQLRAYILSEDGRETGTVIKSHYFQKLHCFLFCFFF